MNTARSMEASGIPNRVQVSQETADLLISQGKGMWLSQRKDPVIAKGKGELVTFFVDRKKDTNPDHSNGSSVGDLSGSAVEVTTFHRITDWTTEVLAGILKEMIVSRRTSGIPRAPKAHLAALERDVTLRNEARSTTVIDEVQEIIELPEYRHKRDRGPGDDVVLDPIVVEELRDFVRTIARRYNDNRE